MFSFHDEDGFPALGSHPSDLLLLLRQAIGRVVVALVRIILLAWVYWSHGRCFGGLGDWASDNGPGVLVVMLEIGHILDCPYEH
jgi:hypothetical protein